MTIGKTVMPRAERERLRLKSSDTVRNRVTESGELPDKAPVNNTHGPFATFSEWSSRADEKAYTNL